MDDHPTRSGVPGDGLLAVEALSIRFGGVKALEDVSFDVMRHQICGLIGPNGAGKTTLFNCLSGIYTPTQGDIVLDGKRLLDLPRHAMAANGLGRTFQNVSLFPSMSVAENVMVGGHCRFASGFLADTLRLPSSRRRSEAVRAEAERLLGLLRLEQFRDTAVSDLPFGIQKRVEFARALASDPKLLLLDEPAAGLNHAELDDLAQLIRRMRDEFGITILLVEHNVALVMALSDKIVALDFGRKIAEGTPHEVRTNPAVIAAYLGEA